MKTADRGRDGPPTMAEGAGLLSAFTTAAHARHDAEVAVVQTLGKLVRAGVIETLEGLPIEVHLAVAHHFTKAEQSMLLDAAEVLVSMPATMRLWQTRQLSWSQIRGLVSQVRSHGRDVRQALDARLAASTDLVELLDADRFDWTVAEAIADLTDPQDRERQEREHAEASFVSVQMGLFGRSRIYGELDALDTAVVVSALDARAATDDTTTTDAPAGGTARGDGAGATVETPARRWSRAKRRARALVGLCADALGGHTCDGHSSPARPLVIVHVPLDRITETTTGVLQVNVPGWLPTLSGKLTETLSRDADVKAVVFDGARPLCVTRTLRAKEPTDATRMAVAARDLGARDPAGRTTIGLSHLHHLRDDHLHHPEQLAYLSPRGHLRIIHRHGWAGTVDGDNGTITWTRRGRTITTLPWHTTLRRAE